MENGCNVILLENKKDLNKWRDGNNISEWKNSYYNFIKLMLSHSLQLGREGT